MSMVLASRLDSGTQAQAPLKIDEPVHHGQSRYRILHSLGRGSFGEVRAVFLHRTTPTDAGVTALSREAGINPSQPHIYRTASFADFMLRWSVPGMH